MDHQQFLTEHLDLVERIVRFVARRHRLSVSDEDDFAGVVHLKLIEHDYAILRKFEGRSSIRTYLTTVIQRLFLDGRIEQWGKWRPSAQARRLGPTAMLLERLVTRDGLSVDEAIEIARTNHRVEETEGELRAWFDQLPRRAPRRFVSDDALVDVAADGPAPDDLLQRAEGTTRGLRIECALRVALQALAAQDRLILQLRYVDGHQVATIARLLRLEQKPLYRRIDQVKETLREALVAQGVSPEDIAAIVDGPSGDIGPVLGRKTKP